jgi:hypothetical protein
LDARGTEEMLEVRADRANVAGGLGGLGGLDATTEPS